MGNHIDFENTIIKNKKIIKAKPRVYYSLRKYKKKGSYDILIYISEHVTLLQLTDSLGNVNNDISAIGYCIFDSSYDKSLVLNRESLDIICAPFVGKEEVAMFEIVFTAVRYI